MKRKHDECFEIALFDGQFSRHDRLYHSFLDVDTDSLYRIIRTAYLHKDFPDNGVFVFVWVEMELDRLGFQVATDWLDSYPVYYFRCGKAYAVSNNLMLLETVVPNAQRSLRPSIDNIVLGGPVGSTHLDEIERVPFGKMLLGGTTLSLADRLDHGDVNSNYKEAMAEADKDISAHVSASMGYSSWSRRPHVVTDLTGGADSRAVLSFILKEVDLRSTGVRCIVAYPNPDANVAGYLIQKYGGKVAEMPTVRSHWERAVREAAAVHGGAMDPGAALPPIAFDDLVHFRGSFGEIAGSSPGSDYIDASLATGDGSIARALEILLIRRRRAGALDLLTTDAISDARNRLHSLLTGLEIDGCRREDLVAEAYLRMRSRSHFGVRGFLDNKVKVAPDPLANRWLVEARRRLDPSEYRYNKVIFDLIRRNRHTELLFEPMAKRKWDKKIVPSELEREHAGMTMVDFESENLSEYTDLLKREIKHECKNRSEYTPVFGIDAHGRGDASLVHSRKIPRYQGLMRFFLDYYEQNSDVWAVFNRDRVSEYVGRESSEFRNDGLDVMAMGRVAVALTWKSGLELFPAVVEKRSFARRYVGTDEESGEA